MRNTQPDRAKNYQLLSDLFAREVPAEGLRQLAGLAAPGATGETADTGLARIYDEAARRAGSPQAAEAAARELASAFAFLFLGLGGRNGAPPYESVYRDPRGLTSGAPTTAMEKVLAGLDIHIQKSFPEPADHIAVELAVAARLAETGAPAAEQARYLGDRLAGWLPAFAAACARGDRTGFYAAAAAVTDAFVAADLERLTAVPVPITKENEDA